MAPSPADGPGVRPPDGGWGWVVVLGAHISIGFAYSMPKVLPIFFKEIQVDLGTTSSEISLISSIMLAAIYGAGPISSVLVNRYGSRPVVMAGGLMCGLSMAAASFGKSIVFLYLCISVIGGCGLSFNLNASLTIISKYFLVRRPLATGLAMAGSPVFLCCLAPLNQYLQDTFGWRGSLLIIGALILNCCVAGALMRPVDRACKTPSDGPRTSDKEEQTPADGAGPCWAKNPCSFLDLSIFKDRGFAIYLVGNVMFIFGAYSPFVFLSNYSISRGVDEYSAAYLLSIMGFVDMIVRPGTGLIASTKCVRPHIQYLFSFAIMLNGACHLSCPLMTNYTLLVVYVVFFGLSFGMVFALMFECLMDLMGSERFPSAVGLFTIIECFPVLIGPPTAGFLVDVYHNYVYLFIMCGSVILTGGVLSLLLNLCHFRALRKHEERKKAKAGGPSESDPKKEEQAEPMAAAAAEEASGATPLEKEALKDV